MKSKEMKTIIKCYVTSVRSVNFCCGLVEIKRRRSAPGLREPVLEDSFLFCEQNTEFQ